MNEIITVEDINSVLMNLNDDFIYEIDCSEMEVGHSYQVDFVNITVETGTRDNIPCIIYIFNIENSLKSGGFAMIDKVGETSPYYRKLWWGPSGWTDNLQLFIRADHIGLDKIKFLMSNHYVFGETVIGGVPTYYFEIPYDLDITFMNKVFLMNSQQRAYEFLITGADAEQIDYELTLYKRGEWNSEIDDFNIIEIVLTDYSVETISANQIKVTFLFTPTLHDIYLEHIKLNYFNFNQVLMKQNNYIELVQEELKNGKINKIDLNILEKNRIIVDDPKYEEESKLTLSYEYLNNKYQEHIINDYINLDLRDKIDQSSLKLNLKLNEGLYSNKYEHTFIIPCTYESFTNQIGEDLANENGTQVYKLYDDQTFDGTYIIGHDTIINGDGFTVTSTEGVTFLIKENVTVKIYNANFENGNPLFIQKENSNLELINCSFTNCTATEYEGMGSVVHCDIEIENLENPVDYTTLIRECSFINSFGAVLHSGELSIRNSTFLINDASVMTNTAPQLLYQTDGNAIIRGNIFEVNLDDDYFCEEEINLKLAQCLFVCGDNATINNVNSKDLQNEENLSFFGVYSNQSHLFLKYYYSSLETCIFVSPIANREDKCLCYGISTIDYIFKYNAQVTQVRWGTENRVNHINLGED